MARGWISHANPLTFDPHNAQFETNGLALFLSQVLIILCLCFILGNVFQRIGQPKVVGELLAGVVLGPTAFGNIPGFDKTIVPQQSLVLLKLTANIGLVFFILLVGLETDTELIRRYARQVALIALPGMAVPFAISVGLANFLYDDLADHGKSFTTFFLFVSTVMAVTSLSVLSRVVSELKLLNTVLGSVTIAAGALNDLIGYILLALGSALGGGGKQINALYQLLVAFALFLLQWFAIRPAMFYLIRRSSFDMTPGAKTRIPNHLLVLTLLGALLSAFITDACNLHPILGALLFGIACPHENFAVMVTEGIETISVGILLPLYFVTSGLNADFKLLNTGTIWGQIILIFVVVFISKFVATATCTRIAGFSWREGAFVAALMQSKSIIELIILNAGQELGVLSPQIYSMLFVTFILSTLTVRPLASWLYTLIDTVEDEADEGQEKYDGGAQEGVAIDSAPTKRHDSLSQRAPICLVAATAADNLALETLMVLMKIAGQNSSMLQEHIATPPVQMNILHFVANDASTASILRMLQYTKDEQADILRHIGKLHRVSFIENTSKKQAKTLARTVLFNDSADVLRSVTQRLELVKRELDAHDSASTSEDDLGRAVVVVPWNSQARLAPVPGDAPSTSVFAKTSTLAAQLFHNLHKYSAGVLVDSAYTSASPSPLWMNEIDDRKTMARVRKLGLGTTSRRPRIIVPYFGGSDDRSCVEMAKQLAANGLIDAVVVSVSQPQLSEDVVHKLENALDAAGSGNHGERDGDETHGSINLMTLNVASDAMQNKERQRDMRGLFGRSLLTTEEEDDGGPSKLSSFDASSTEQTELVETLDGVISVTLPQAFIDKTETKTHVEAILTYIAPLLDARQGDIVLAGRGKIQQRTADFRLQVEALKQTLDGRKKGRSEAEVHDRDTEVRSMGRVLGACCEAVLISEISAHVFVLQSRLARQS